MKYALYLFFSLITVSSSVFGFQNEKLAKADELFNSGRYWDAFTIYKQISGDGEIYVMKKIEDSKACMVFKKRYENFRGLKNYPKAINNLENLIEINPLDPNKSDLGVMAYLHARKLQQKAYTQQFRVEAEVKLKEASDYYRMALQEGIPSEEIFPKLKLCEKQLRIVSSDMEFEIPEPDYTEDFRKIEPSLPVERSRKVLILDQKASPADPEEEPSFSEFQ
ncbi:hypothetical protein [Jiulongibacter sp. NS-SX5]|uniref:hypothetical protein n=1 Tax=Jiulongibacter sp. NS-SX5 TaxID=3463854 RepID=UPI0040585701